MDLISLLFDFIIFHLFQSLSFLTFDSSVIFEILFSRSSLHPLSSQGSTFSNVTLNCHHLIHFYLWLNLHQPFCPNLHIIQCLTLFSVPSYFFFFHPKIATFPNPHIAIAWSLVHNFISSNVWLSQTYSTFIHFPIFLIHASFNVPITRV